MARRQVSHPDAVDLMLEQWRREIPGVDASPLAVFGRLHRAFDRYQHQLTRVLGRFDVSISAFGILTALRRAGEPYRRTAGDLADTTLLTTGGITQRVDRLEAAGLVRRERDLEDRRVVYIGLTPEGLALTDKVVEAHFANERRMLAKLTQNERAQLAKLLSKLEHSLEVSEFQPEG
ncbi:MarR family winged helix-turn-helix transcriptional regulator [Amycolatopsis granulosa]|uniref:MarR family winged helix-turn-helix transcriptional regulator n=1 Tax=Amycolatopsis granulosa TaxID=185684 RepID=UPI0014218992|nr:MarR family transcriptional regulator [Amycolatopsis granulosa]NIH83707.1 DNA-binding MarR family transcriptional regulator [Amycolatopsis granulosa]